MLSPRVVDMGLALGYGLYIIFHVLRVYFEYTQFTYIKRKMFFERKSIDDFKDRRRKFIHKLTIVNNGRAELKWKCVNDFSNPKRASNLHIFFSLLILCNSQNIL